MTEPRKADELRPVTIEPFPTCAAGSVIITQGRTRVLCTASIADEAPAWLFDQSLGRATRGWVTAEYSMLPGSTPDRKKRGPDSRGTEIQRLIGRCLRAAVDLDKIPGLAITCDCDVLAADGGTRTAAVTGAFVALAKAIGVAVRDGRIQHDPLLGPVAAVSVGIVDGSPRLDLDYDLDVRAQVDMNVSMDHRGRFVEVQGTAEGETFERELLDRLLDLAEKGIRKLIRIQRDALGD